MIRIVKHPRLDNISIRDLVPFVRHRLSRKATTELRQRAARFTVCAASTGPRDHVRVSQRRCQVEACAWEAQHLGAGD